MREEIRPLSVSDLDAAQDLLDVVYASHPFPIGGGWNMRLLREVLDEGHGFGLFGGDNDELRAFVIYRMVDELLDITLLATKMQFQRQGLMRKLFGHVLASRPAGRSILLEVHEANQPAVLFYESLGFQLRGRRPGYYRDGGAALLYSYDK